MVFLVSDRISDYSLVLYALSAISEINLSKSLVISDDATMKIAGNKGIKNRPSQSTDVMPILSVWIDTYAMKNIKTSNLNFFLMIPRIV